MPTDLFFSQIMPRNPSSGIEHGKMRDDVSDRASVKTANESFGDDRESFLNTLDQISKDHNPIEISPGDSGEKSCEIHEFDSADKFDTTSHLADGHEAVMSEMTTQQENELDNVKVQKSHALNFLAFINILEKLGFHDSAGGSSLPKKSDEALGDAEGLAALKTLIARLGQSDLEPSAGMKAGLDRLRQFITHFLQNNASLQTSGNRMDGLTPNQVAELVDLDHLVKGLNPGDADLKNGFNVQTGEGASGQKLSDTIPIMSRVAPDPAKNFGETGFSPSDEKSRCASQPGDPGKPDLAKFPLESGTVETENKGNNKVAEVEASENAKEPRSLEKVRTDASGLKDGSDTPGKTRAPSQAGLINRISSTIDSGKQFNGESAQQNLPNNESSPASKLINDAQTAKENHIKMDSAISNESGSKVTKVDTGTHDNGLLNSQNHTAEKVFETTSSSRETEAGTLRTQTMDQIVRKAVIHLRNGQHEAKIDLKPDFLGHIRMQVITENHQVTVKILTQFPFVKEMVENNIHQLKTDLQQQGLNVDKLEVSVSHDSDEHKYPKENTDRAKAQQRKLDRNHPENKKEEIRQQTVPSVKTTAGGSKVDYFA